MGENARANFIQLMKEHVERLNEDLARANALREDGTLTDDEADNACGRIAGEIERVNEMIAEFSKNL